MSDFISDLRSEMVEAAERLERRGRIGQAAWPLHPRVWGPAATRGAIAVAACAIAVVVALTVLKSPAPQPARLHVVDVVRVGGQPSCAVLAGGSLWIGDTNGGVTRLDPRTRRITGRVPTGGDVTSVFTGNGQLWAARLENRNFPNNTTTLLRIDPQTGRVIVRFPTRRQIGDIEVSGGAAWMSDASVGTIDRFDPIRLRVTSRTQDPDGMLLAGTAHTLWALSSSGTLTEIAAASGAIVHRVPHVVPVVTQGEDSQSMLAADATGAWVSYPDDGTVARVEDGRLIDRITVGAGARLIAATPRTLWVTYGDSARLRYALAKIDARSGRIISTLSLGSQQPKTLVPVGETLWIITTGGNALLIHP